MQLAFIKDVMTVDGDVRFHAGTVKDYPKSTWHDLATRLDKPLDEFAQPVDILAKQMVVGKSDEEVKSYGAHDNEKLPKPKLIRKGAKK